MIRDQCPSLCSSCTRPAPATASRCWRSCKFAGICPWVDHKMLGLRWHRQTARVRVCSPSSRRLATLGSRFAGLAALTTAPRSPIRTGSCLSMPNRALQDVGVDDLFGFLHFRMSVDTRRPPAARRRNAATPTATVPRGPGCPRRASPPRPAPGSPTPSAAPAAGPARPPAPVPLRGAPRPPPPGPSPSGPSPRRAARAPRRTEIATPRCRSEPGATPRRPPAPG